MEYTFFRFIPGKELIFFFQMAPTRGLYNDYLLSYDFLNIFFHPAIFGIFAYFSGIRNIQKMSSCLQLLRLRNKKTGHFLPTYMHNEENMLPFYAPLLCCKYPPSQDTLPRRVDAK